MTDLEPLWNIRLRTPRLELRLPTDDELEELYRVAAAGIHPRDTMPFHEPWTDTLTRESFRDFHHTVWSTWSPESWSCEFATFVDGRVIGMQSISAKNFVRERIIRTASWLGMPYQRRGYGTEQRAAVLEFGFRGLGARAALSGARLDSVASQRIAAKLGYRTTGSHASASRGTPTSTYEYRLDSNNWTCPVPVVLAGVEPALPLFGLAD